MDALTDAELLDLFVKDKHEAAFEEIIRRYGPMVLATCHRTITEEHVVQEVFQTTFLVLAKKAASLRSSGALAAWLHNVAYRVSLRLRGKLLESRKREVSLDEALEIPMNDHSLQWQELRPVLDEELECMPEKYSAPLVLCYLNGMTNDEAARVLNWPIGSISRRLDRARELLRARLTKRGLALSTASLFTLLQEKASAATATVSPELIALTKKTAVLIATQTTTTGLLSAKIAGVLNETVKAMFIEKLKLAAATTLFVTTLGASTVVIAKNFILKNESSNLNPPSFNQSAGRDKLNLEPSPGTQPTHKSEAAQIASSRSVLSKSETKSQTQSKLPSRLLPLSGLEGSTGSEFQDASNLSISKKLNSTFIDFLKFDHTPLETVLAQLADLSRDQDPNHEGITFSVDEAIASRPITLNMRKTSLLKGISLLCYRYELVYKVDTNCVVLQLDTRPQRILKAAEKH